MKRLERRNEAGRDETGRDQAAWQTLVSLYSPLVAHWLRRDGFQAADIDDLTQEIFAAVDGGIERFQNDGKAGSFRRWLRAIARHKAADRLREAKRSPAAEGGSDALRELEAIGDSDAALDLDAGTPELAEERRILYEQAIRLLETDFQETTWRAFWRVVIEERAAEEVARELGVSVNAVYLAKSRVLRRLREEFVSLMD